MPAPTAASTIVPALQAAGFPLTAKGDRYSCPTGGGTLSVRRLSPVATVAVVEFFGDVTRGIELDMLVRVAEVLKAAGYSPIRDAYEVRVNWAECASERRAA